MKEDKKEGGYMKGGIHGYMLLNATIGWIFKIAIMLVALWIFAMMLGLVLFAGGSIIGAVFGAIINFINTQPTTIGFVAIVGVGICLMGYSLYIGSNHNKYESSYKKASAEQIFTIEYLAGKRGQEFKFNRHPSKQEAEEIIIQLMMENK